MKKIVSVLMFGAAVMLGAQTTQAQEAREIAKEKVMKLDEMLDLDEKQEEIVHRAYIAYEINSAKKGAAKGAKRDKEAVQADMRKNQMSLYKIMKETLYPEQFEKYVDFRKENMSEEELRMMESWKERKAKKANKSLKEKR